MYSKNDYRYYLENQLMHSDDFLAHYGVKGMKWKKRKKKYEYIDMNDVSLNDPRVSTPHQIENSIRAVRTIAEVADNNVKYQQQEDKKIKNRLKKKLSGNRKKRNVKSSVFNKNVWKREVPKGKKLKGSKNIYVSHE